MKLSGQKRKRKSPEDFPEFPAEPPEFAAKTEEWMAKVKLENVRSWEWEAEGNFHVGPRVLASSALIWFRKVNGTARIQRHRQKITSGDLLIIPQATEHEFFQKGSRPAEFVSVLVDARIFGNISFFDLLGFPPVVRADKTGMIEHAFSIMPWEYARKPAAWEISLSTQVSRVLIHVLRHYSKDFRINKTGGDVTLLTRMLPAFEMIEKEFKQPCLKVDRLAEAVHLGQTRFRQLFSKVTGLSPVNYLQRRRVEEACSLLHDGTYSMDQVAEVAGFSDLAFFNRVFKKWTGTTPGRYARGDRKT